MTFGNSAAGERKTRAGRTALLLTGAAMVGLLAANPALAQDRQGPSAEAGAAQTRSFNIPAQPLAAAINAFGAQSGLQITAEADVTAGVQASAVIGDYEPAEALSLLLSGTGVTWRMAGENIVVLTRAYGGSDGAITLGAVRVESAGAAADGRVSYPANASASVALFTDTPVIEAPFSVGVYNETLIEDQRAFSLAEVLQNEPSVAVQMPGGYYGVQNLSSRGFRVDNFNGYRVDGLPVIHTVAASIDDKSQVELLKGPAGLRFGFMPPGGAINLVRKRPALEFSTSVQFDVDTFGALYSQLDVSDTVADGTFGYRLVLAGEDFESFYDHASGDRVTGSLFAEWRPTRSVTLWASAAAQDFERSGYFGPMITALGTVLDTGVKTNIMQDWARNYHETLDLASGVDIAFNQNWRLRTSISYQETGRESRLSYPYSVEENGDYTEGALLSNGPFEWETTGGHAHLEGSFATGPLRHDVVVGAQFYNYTSAGQRSFPDVGPNNAYQLNRLPIPAVAWRPAADPFEYQEAGFFATDTIAFTDRISALFGIRNSQYENIDPGPVYNGRVSTWSPTLALMYEPMDDVHTYITWTEGVQDGGYDNDTFEPLGVQASEQWEAGVKAEWLGGRVSGEAAVFQIEQDLQITDPIGTDRFDGLRRHRGVELALRAFVTDFLQAGVATMLLDAEQVETDDPALNGKTPQYVPDYQVNVWGEFATPWVSGLSLTADARFVDGQYLDQTEQFAIDGYWVLDLGARYRFQVNDNDWTLRLNVENALDERYYESGEFYPGDAGYLSYGAPISANFSIAMAF